MDASHLGVEAVTVLDYVFEVDYWGWTKSVLFYTMLAICAAQTFYPILMIIAMFIRQLGFLAQWFHEVSPIVHCLLLTLFLAAVFLLSLPSCILPDS